MSVTMLQKCRRMGIYVRGAMALMMLAGLLGLGAVALAQQPTAKELLQGAPSEPETKTTPPDASRGKSPRAPKAPRDDFNRGLPRTSVQGFLEAANDADYERASGAED